MEDHDSLTHKRDESQFPLHLTSITTIPKNITSIGDDAFSEYEQLTNFVIPPSVTSFGGCAFWNCKSLTNIVIPPTIKSICYGAFCNCTSLTEIIIPPSVTWIGADAFRGCTSLSNIIIPSSITSIGAMAFWGCTSITNIVIPPSVTSIGNGAFCYCKSLTNIEIPPSVTGNLSYGIFQKCNSLQSITITLPLALEECSEPNLLKQAIRAMTPKNMEEWVKTRAQDGRLPLCTAAAVSMKWPDVKRIFEANKIAIYDKDLATGLSAFMLAAVGINSDLESVYRLCREYPVAIML